MRQFCCAFFKRAPLCSVFSGRSTFGCALACGARDVWELLITADLKGSSAPFRPTIWSLELHLGVTFFLTYRRTNGKFKNSLQSEKVERRTIFENRAN